MEDLKSRLASDLQRIAEPLEDSAFTYGFNTKSLVKIGEYWRTKFDWKKQVKALNEFPQFKTDLDGIEVHFLHVKPDPAKAKGKTVLPLLLVHGWPGREGARELF